MGLSDFGAVITDSLPIPELIEILKYSFHECEFNEVQNILLNRDKDLKIELERLIQDRDSYKEEVVMWGRTHELMKLQKLKLEKMLVVSERKCRKLTGTIARLREEQRNQDLRSMELYEKVCREISDMRIERNNLTSENKRINQKNVENEKMLSVYEEKFQLLEGKFQIIELENSNLEEQLYRSEIKCREQKETIRRLTKEQKNRKKLSEEEVYGKVREENSRVKNEKNELLSENEWLKQKNLEIEQLLGVYQEKFQVLDVRLMKIEHEIECLVRKKMAADQIKELGETLFEVCLIGKRMVCQNLESELRQNELESGVKENNGNKVLSSPDSSSHYSPQAKIHGANGNTGYEGPQCSGTETQQLKTSVKHGDVGGGNVYSDCGVAVRGQSTRGMTCSSSASGNIIDVCDSDDGTNPSENNKSIFRILLSDQKTKRGRTDNSPSDLISKRKRSLYGNEGDKAPTNNKENESLDSTCDGKPAPVSPQAATKHATPCRASQTRPLSVLGLAYEDSTESEDESCSDSYMNNLIAILQSKSCSRR